MECVRKVTEDIFWVGGNDRRLALFENVYPIPQGVSYNSYLIMDEKTVLTDGVDHAVTKQFFENVSALLKDRPLDYLIINHMEPDHAGSIAEIVKRYPEVTLVCNEKTKKMLSQFFAEEFQIMTVGPKDSLCTGNHTFSFVMAPMVHWPEVMVTYDASAKVLFSADAFGTFGALEGHLFADAMDFQTQWLPEARRYYANIVGKYGPSVQALLKAASQLEIEAICPLHGPVIRKDFSLYLKAYQSWSTYMPEEEGVLIAYASIYGNTENAAEVLAFELSQRGVKNIRVCDTASTHPSYLVAEAFRCSHLVFAAASYNSGLFDSMEILLNDLVHHNLQNRKVILIENGSWAPSAGKKMTELVGQMKQTEIIAPLLTVRSSLKPEQREKISAIADAIAQSIKKE